MSPLPRCSFVIPAHNAARTLAQTLDSLLAQRDADWEALIVDDASRDGTSVLLAAHASRDRRFVALRGSGVDGASGARNVGLRQARGQRVVFLDSDDWIAPDYLDRMHAALDANPGAAAAYCDYQRVMPDGTLAPVSSSPEVARAPFDSFARNCAVAIHAVLIERDRVLRAGCFDTALRTCEDWDLWQRIARMGGLWVHVAEPMAFYRSSENSLSQNAERLLQDAAVVVHRAYGVDPRVPDPEPAHAAGASRAHSMSPELALAYFALWCRAIDARRGQTHALASDMLEALPADAEHAGAVAITLLDGLVAGLRTVPRQLVSHWADHRPTITALIDSLGALWRDAVAARRVQYAFERLLLQHDDLAVPRALSLTLGLRVNLRAPAPLTPPEGIDRLYVHLCDGERVLAVVEPGALGSFAPRQWIELAAQRLGWKAVIKLAGPSVARSITPRRLADATKSACGQIRRGALRERGWRTVLKAAARDALVAAAASAGDGSHAATLERMRSEAQDDVGRATPSSFLARPQARGNAARQERPADNRRAYWDDFFRTPDPWNYGSAYEQEKYAFQLDLLPQGPRAFVLELACAEGRFTEQLAPRARRLIAADVSATALARAAERCRGHEHVEFRTIDLAIDTLPQGADVIFCSEVLYYLGSEAELRRVAEKIAAALRPGGHLITANPLTLKDEPARTGFDWGTSWGAKTISRVFAEVPGLALERSLCTDLYRIDRFVRHDSTAKPPTPLIESRPITAEIEHEVARHVVWGGATALRTDLATTERHQRIPVLAYHRVADDGPPALARYRVSAEAFGTQMSWLRQNGYHAIVADELGWFLRRQHPFVGRPVVITFDDGYQDFADAAWPMLRRHDMRAEIFVVTDLVGGHAEWDRRFGEPAPLMGAKTIAALAGQGARFGSHLASHRGADGLSTRELAEELLRSQRCLLRWTGLPPCALAAPFGLTDERLRLLAAQCGYRVGFSTQSAAATLADDPMHLPRIEVRGDMALEEFVGVLEACR
jgi:peptidoglycan/xylan/chitin deacetylase (PgdA/CDA1 family)/2-polyprenyl-3-methyl-5-hydroxy-6-metoxy-1,4-benzoquinol methylase